MAINSFDVRALFSVQTAAEILNLALELAEAVGLPVTSWRAGDPTKTTIQHQAETLAARDVASADYAKAGFLSSVEGEWVPVHASEVYGVEARAATASTPTVTLANAGGGLFTFDAGDVSVKASGSGAEFHTTSGGTLGPGGSLTLDLIAEVAGSDGTVATDEIDTLITTFPGVSIASSTDSVGFDAQTPAEIKTDCADTLGALSPDGPADALEYVVRQKKFTGVETITRSRATEDDDTGRSTVYVAGPSGAVDGASVIAAQAAIETWASPLCFRGTATNATEVTIPVTAVLHGDDLPADYVAQSTSALQTLFAAFPIADDSGGEVPTSEIIGTLTDLLRDWGVSPARRKVVLSAPAATIAYAEGEVPKLGVVTITSV